MPEITLFLMLCCIMHASIYFAVSGLVRNAPDSFWKWWGVRDAKTKLHNQLANYLNLVVVFNVVPYLVLEFMF